MDTAEFYAHTLENVPNPEHWQEMGDRLRNVAQRAAEFPAAFSLEEHTMELEF